MSCNKIIVQTDCLEVVNSMKDGFSATAACAIFDECQEIWDWFDVISIEHCNREANMVAHRLARDSFMAKRTCNWVEEVPSFLIADLANDVTMFSNE